jgi:hypothetical protein
MPRLSLEIDEAFESALRNLSGPERLSKAEVIQNAMSTYKYLKGEVSKSDGNRVAILDKEGNLLQDLILP